MNKAKVQRRVAKKHRNVNPEKTARFRALRKFAAVCLLTLICCRGAVAQFAIDWFTIDGGAGTSIGDELYTVSATIGQPDAGLTMRSGNYSVVGGFWSILASAQTPSAPALTISVTPTNTVLVSWPSPSTGFLLQQNSDSVASVNWSNVTSGIQDDGSRKTLIVDPPAGTRFFRLFKP